MRIKVKEKMPMTNEDLVYEYFRCIGNKDLNSLLDLFTYDAVIYEPFSKSTGLQGRSGIEPFLRIALLANSGFQRKIEIQKPGVGRSEDNNKIIALVTFEKGDKVKGRFTFQFDSSDKDRSGTSKIKTLHIEFL